MRAETTLFDASDASGTSAKRDLGGVVYTEFRSSAVVTKRGAGAEPDTSFLAPWVTGKSGVEWGTGGLMGDAFGVVKRDEAYPSATSVHDIVRKHSECSPLAGVHLNAYFSALGLLSSSMHCADRPLNPLAFLNFKQLRKAPRTEGSTLRKRAPNY